jgi:hypothetical protein
MRNKIAQLAASQILRVTEADMIERARVIAEEQHIPLEVALKAVMHRQNLALKALGHVTRTRDV